MAATRDDLAAIARQAMLDRGLLPDFSAAALAEAHALTGAADDDDSSIQDARHLTWISIDNDDSRDLDQLTVAQPLDGGAVKVLVAVADVDAAVKQGAAIDDHARANTTSVYTAARVFPMLPERLSTDLTSLNEGQARLAIVTEMVVSAEGVVTGSTLYRARVLNRARLTYADVSAWIEHDGDPLPRLSAVPRLSDQLRIQARIARAMRTRRQERGALDLETPHAQVVFDDDGMASLRDVEQNAARSLIEDFMLATNAAIAQYLAARRLPSLRRVLRAPQRWPRIVELAASLNDALPDEPSATALQAFLSRRRQADPDRFADLSLSVVKLLGSGEYAVQNGDTPSDGHFGLAVKDYTHATAPNRRFPDLVTQRLVKAALAGRPAPYDAATLEALARHCTEQEDDAARVERQVRKSAAALLLQGRIGERFDGIVTGASSKGTWVRVLTPPVEGRIVEGTGGLDVGDRVRVDLRHTDVERGFIDFVASTPRDGARRSGP